MASLRDRLERLERRTKPAHLPTEEEEALMSLLLKELRVQQAESEGEEPDPEDLTHTEAEDRAELAASESYLTYLDDVRQREMRPEVLAGIEEDERATRERIEELEANFRKGARE